MKIFIIGLFIFPLLALAQSPTDTVSLNEGNFHTAWSHSAKYPVRVAWHLTIDMLNCAEPLKRSNNFGPDSQLMKETNLDRDYKGSGYDRGHNFDAADDACAGPLNAHCWYFTNMAPQTKHLNEITWKALEDQCRKWVESGDELYIECGSFGKAKTIGIDKVWVPEYCWKIIRHKSGVIDSYLMPNTDDVNTQKFGYYHTDITIIRQKTGIETL